MIRKIWKYALEIKDGVQTIQIPIDGTIIFVHDQGGLPTIWVEVYPNYASMENRCFMVFGTGHEIPAMCNYVGSTMSGSFVWHVYEQVSGKTHLL